MNTIQAQLALLKTDQQNIQQGIQQKSDQINNLAKELEQHRGAYAYNQLIIQRLENILTESSIQPSP